MFDGVSTVIPGAKNARQVEDNSAAAELRGLSEKQMETVRSVYDRYIRPCVPQRW
jgi:aryl-alcohol dehydrogenase-like predicted oxidoreductase